MKKQITEMGSNKKKVNQSAWLGRGKGYVFFSLVVAIAAMAFLPEVSANWGGVGASRPEGRVEPQQAIAVSLPNQSGNAGANVSIPITVGDVTGQGVLAYDFVVQFNPAVLQLAGTPVSNGGTLSSGFTINPNPMSGSLVVSGFGTSALTGGGTLLNINFTVVGVAGTNSPLTFQSFRFNEGTPLVSLTNGSFMVSAPTVAVSLPVQSGNPGANVVVPISAGDVTGLGVLAYDFTVLFDPAVIQPAAMPVSNIGTLSSGFTINPNTGTAGRITVSGFGTAALSGAGTLLNLNFTVVGASGTNSPLTFQPFRFNEGTPLVSLTNGSFSVAQATYTVTKTADTNDGACNTDCSLREAVAAANATASSDTIGFDAIVFASAQTITLTAQLLIVTSATGGALTIIGTGADLLIVSGNNTTSRVFNINAGANVTLSGLKITGGRITSSNGGGLRNLGTLAVIKCTISANTAGSTATGGGISNTGTLTITDSTISGNTTSMDGGGVLNSSGTVTIINSTISGNTAANFGGGIYNQSTLTATNSTIFGNTANGGNGGGVFNDSATVNAENTIIAGNTSSAGPDFEGELASLGYNLIGDSGATVITGITTGNILNQSAMLAPLGSYGGATQTHALLTGSPAINAGNTATSTSIDQRGAARVGVADIGAFELNNTTNGGAFRAVLPRGRQGQSYSITLVPNSGSLTYSVSGTLPPGLDFNNSFATPEPDRVLENLGSRKIRVPSVPAAIITLTGTPTAFGTFNFALTATNGVNSNTTNYAADILGPTASAVSLGGYVLTSLGRAPRNATVTLTDLNGEDRVTTVNRWGYYQFTAVEASQTYFVTVRAKGYSFNPPTAIVTPNFEISDLNFTALTTR